MRGPLKTSESLAYAVIMLFIVAVTAIAVYSQEIQKQVSIVCFTASWCPNCPNQKAICEQTAKEKGVSVLYVDIDQSPKAAQNFGVNGTVPTTFVVVRTPRQGSREVTLVPHTKVVGISSKAKMSRYIDEAKEAK